MKLQVIGKAALALVVGCLCAPSAKATIMVQAGAGHPHQGSGTYYWDYEWSDHNWLITDGRSIARSASGANQSWAWDTPIPITSTNAVWHVIAYAASNSGLYQFTNRICTFNSNGTFYTCGSTVTAGNVSQATVPTYGTAYSQSFFYCASSGACGSSNAFYAVRAY